MFFWRRGRHPIGDEELSSYVDGRLEPAARARLEAHIEACAACREALTELRALGGALREMPRPAAPRSFALREADVRPAAAPRAVGALSRAPALLGGVAMIAFVSFWTLVSVDVLTQPEEGAGSAALMPGDGAMMERAIIEGGSAEDEGQADASDSDDQAEKRVAPSFDFDAASPNGLSPPAVPATVECPATGDCVELYSLFLLGPTPTPTPTATPTPTPVPGTEAGPADGWRGPLRAGEAAAVGVTLVAGGSLALVWWRRRS